MLAAGGTLTVRAQDSIEIGYIGRGEIDLIDEVALALVERDPNRFGTVQFTGPDHLRLTALNPDAQVLLGLAEIKETADLEAETIIANLYDLTPTDGLDLQLSGADDTVASSVEVNVIADDPAFTGTTDGTGPDISQRLIARIRPENPDLPIADGEVTVSFGRFDNGEITTATGSLVVSDVIISDAATFRQRLFDVYAETTFTGVRPDMDGQILAVATQGLPDGGLDFRMYERRQIDTRNILTNRPDPTSVIGGGTDGREETLAELATYLTLDRSDLGQGHVSLLPRGIELADYISGLPAKGADEDDPLLQFLRYRDAGLPLVILRN